MKKRIEYMIRMTEQLYAEATVARLDIVHSLDRLRQDLIWLYREAEEYDVE